MNANKPASPLPKFTGEYDALSGPDQERCRKVLRWLIEEGALDATLSLSQKPHVVVVHRSGFVSSSISGSRT